MEEVPASADGRARAWQACILVAVAACILVPSAAAAQSDEPVGSAAGIRNRALGFEAVPGGPGKRIVLQPEMIARLGIETAAASGDGRTAVPWSAVFYDAKGAAWIYVSRKPGLFVGQRVQVSDIVDGQALLSDGPPAGMPVVTAGAAALNGAGMFGR